MKRPPWSPGCRPQGCRRGRRTLPCNLELDDQIRSQWTRRRVVEQSCEQGRSQPEGGIRDHPVRPGGHFDPTEILANNLDLVDQTRFARPLTEPPGPGGVGFDRDDSSPGSSQWKSQGTCASPDLDYQLAGSGTDGINEPADLISINEEVLSE